MRRPGMPWKETRPFEERRTFITTCKDSDESFTAICNRFGISLQKGYKWLARFDEGGLEARVDRSRRPHSNSRAIAFCRGVGQRVAQATTSLGSP